MELYPAGFDQLARRVHLVFVPAFADIESIVFPSRPFVVLLAGNSEDVPVDVIYSTVEYLLDRHAVYIMSWGRGARRSEDIADEAIAMRGFDRTDSVTIMTTAHEGETLHEVLAFATTLAIPAEALASATTDVVLVFYGQAGWYDEARTLLEDMLTSGAA
jgi:pentatricopeptide repeat protein